MPLYGNDIDETTSPYHAGLGFAVKLNKAVPFTGQAALQELKERGVDRRLIGFRVDSRKIARSGMPILRGEEKVGWVTSGIPSPTLGFPIALGYLDSKVVDPVGLMVDIRGSRARITPEPLPFFSRTRQRSGRAL
jgi:aminomethyltransferase